MRSLILSENSKYYFGAARVIVNIQRCNQLIPYINVIGAVINDCLSPAKNLINGNEQRVIYEWLHKGSSPASFFVAARPAEELSYIHGHSVCRRAIAQRVIWLHSCELSFQSTPHLYLFSDATCSGGGLIYFHSPQQQQDDGRLRAAHILTGKYLPKFFSVH